MKQVKMYEVVSNYNDSIEDNLTLLQAKQLKKDLDTYNKEIGFDEIITIQEYYEVFI